jgi:hypothetical protein
MDLKAVPLCERGTAFRSQFTPHLVSDLVREPPPCDERPHRDLVRDSAFRSRERRHDLQVPILAPRTAQERADRIGLGSRVELGGSLTQP